MFYYRSKIDNQYVVITPAPIKNTENWIEISEEEYNSQEEINWEQYYSSMINLIQKYRETKDKNRNLPSFDMWFHVIRNKKE